MGSKALRGSLQNRLGEKSTWRMPVVGEGATELCFSDRHAYSVTRVSDSGKTFWAKMDDAKRTDGGGMTDSGQTYEYTPNPLAVEVEVRWTGKGWKKLNSSNYFTLGVRRKYHDFSF